MKPKRIDRQLQRLDGPPRAGTGSGEQLSRPDGPPSKRRRGKVIYTLKITNLKLSYEMEVTCGAPVRAKRARRAIGALSGEQGGRSE